MENPINDVHGHAAFMTQETTGEREKGEFVFVSRNRTFSPFSFLLFISRYGCSVTVAVVEWGLLAPRRLRA
jgi:hypothetical protein